MSAVEGTPHRHDPSYFRVPARESKLVESNIENVVGCNTRSVEFGAIIEKYYSSLVWPDVLVLHNSAITSITASLSDDLNDDELYCISQALYQTISVYENLSRENALQDIIERVLLGVYEIRKVKFLPERCNECDEIIEHLAKLFHTFLVFYYKNSATNSSK